MSEQTFNFTQVDQETRLDQFVLENLQAINACTEISRSQINKLIKEGYIRILNKKEAKPGSLVKEGQSVEVIIPEQKSSHLEPYDFPLDIRYEDEHLLVINKPAGLTVHPGAGNKDQTLLNAVVHYLGSQNPCLPHRLDKDTSGLIIVAKNEKIKALLVKDFLHKNVERYYQALAMITPRAKREIQFEDSGQIKTNITRSSQNRLKMMVSDAQQGKVAVTNWEVSEKFTYAYLLKLKLDTGRTHQIRVHLEALGSPIIGDPVYGDFSALPKQLLLNHQSLGRQALHAFQIKFNHPITKEKLSFTAELPEDIEEIISIFKEFKN